MAARRKPVKPETPPEPVRVEALGDRAVLHLEGAVGVAQAKRLHALALELAGAGRTVDVRCEHLQYLDCAAAQVLLALSQSLKSRGAEMAVQNLPDSVQQTLRHAGLASAF
jgi:anti-anti-sigma factor